MLFRSLEDDKDNIEEYESHPKGLSVYEINGPFFFGAANKYKEILKEVGIRSEVMILRMRNVPFVDATGMHNFLEVLKTLNHYKVKIVLSGVQPGVYDTLIKSDIENFIPRDQICSEYNLAKLKAVELLESMK